MTRTVSNGCSTISEDYHRSRRSPAVSCSWGRAYSPRVYTELGSVDPALQMFKRQKKRPAVEVPTNLIGCWHLVPTGKPDEEPSELEFREDGTLLYSIEAKDRWQIMRLTYRVEGAELVTDQPS